MARKEPTIETKSENKQMVFRYILNHPDSTKQELFVHLGISLPTIQQALLFLLKEDLIEESGKAKNTGGRNAITYSIKKTGRYSIGLFLSAHHLTAVAVDLTGTILSLKRESLTIAPHEDNYLRRIGDIVECVKAEANIPADVLLGVGIAISSLVAEDRETILYGMTYDFSGVDRKLLSSYIPYDTWLFHDSKAAGFAETWLNEEIRNAIYLNIGNSVGSSVIIGGESYIGNHRLAGEFGHIMVDHSRSKKCYCGRFGCVDTVCNVGVLEDNGNRTIAEFFQTLDNGDEASAAIWDTYTTHLARAIQSVHMILDCTFILGGYLGACIGNHIQDLQNILNELDPFGRKAEEYVLPCRHKTESTAAGAALSVINLFINQM